MYPYRDYVFEYFAGLDSPQADDDEINLLTYSEIANFTNGGWDPSKFNKYPRYPLTTWPAVYVATFFGFVLSLVLILFEWLKRRRAIKIKDSHEIKGLGGLYLAVFLDSYGVTMCMPYIGILTVQFGCTAFQATMVTTVFALCQTVGTVILGILADYMNKKLILTLTLGFGSLSLGLCGICTFLPTGNEEDNKGGFNYAYMGLILSRAVGGFFASTVSIIETLIAEQSTAENRTQNIAQVMAYFGMGALAGPVIGGMVYDYGLEVLCYSSAMVTLVNTVWAIVSVKIPDPVKGSKAAARQEQQKFTKHKVLTKHQWKRQKNEPVRDALATIHRHPVIFLLLFATVWATGAPTLSAAVGGLFVLQAYKWGPLQIAGMSLYAGICGVWAQMTLAGKISENFGDAGSILVGNILRSAGSFGFLILSPATPWVLAPVEAATGSMINAQLQSLLTSFAPPHALGTLFGFMQAMRSFGEAIAPPIGGWLLDQNLLLPFKASGWACAICGMLFLPYICLEPEPPDFEDTTGKKNEERDKIKVPAFNWILLISQWTLPMLMNMFCLLACSFCMHLATYQYVNQMHMYEKQNNVTAAPHWMLEGVDDSVIATQQTLPIDADALNEMTITIPLMLVFFCVMAKELHIWTKVMWSSSLFAVCKGILSLVTVTPDKTGWEGCKDKLQSSGIKYLTEEVQKEWVIHQIWKMQFFGSHFDRVGSDIDYCVGSLFSGQTRLFDFSCLYALGLFELVRRKTILQKVRFGNLILGALGAVCIAIQFLEINTAFVDRAYYTADILAAYIMMFLCYTNTPLQIAVKWWTRVGEEQFFRNPGPIRSGTLLGLPVAHKHVREEGDVFVPSCCLPFCFLGFDGYHHIVTSKKIVRKKRSVALERHDDDDDDDDTTSDSDLDAEETYLEELGLENQRLKQEVKDLRSVLQLALPTV